MVTVWQPTLVLGRVRVNLPARLLFRRGQLAGRHLELALMHRNGQSTAFGAMRPSSKHAEESRALALQNTFTLKTLWTMLFLLTFNLVWRAFRSQDRKEKGSLCNHNARGQPGTTCKMTVNKNLVSVSSPSGPAGSQWKHDVRLTCSVILNFFLLAFVTA